MIKKIPIVYRKVQMMKNKLDLDQLLKFAIDYKQYELDQLLLIRIKKMQEILGFLLAEKRIYEFFVLFMYIVQKDNSIHAFFRNFLNETEMKKKFTFYQKIINSIIPLAELIRDDDLFLHILTCLGGFYESFGYEDGKKFYKKGLIIAEERNHQFYLHKFKEKIENYGIEIDFYTKDEIMNMPFSDTLKGLDFFKFSRINSIADPNIRGLMMIAKQDSDPSEILKTCENLIIGYFPSFLGQSEGIHSLGTKAIMCLKHERWHDVFNLVQDFRLFQENFCDNCDDKSQRSKEWNLKMSDLEEMMIKIINIKNKYGSNY